MIPEPFGGGDLYQVGDCVVKENTGLCRITDIVHLDGMDVGQTVEKGYKFVHGDVLYKTIQDSLLIQEQYVPGEGTESLYAVIDETHAGTQENPIPYDGNMALEKGKYYSQDGVIYLCNRDTENPVYHNLSDLIGLYVEKATE